MKPRLLSGTSADLFDPAWRFLLCADAEGEEESISGMAEEVASSVSEPVSFHSLVQDEKLRDHAARFNSIDELVRANLESRQKLSKAIVPPGKEASDEDIAAFNRAIGVPNEADGYDWPVAQGGQAPDEDLQLARAEWSAFFFENRFSKTQAENAMAKVAEMERRQQQAMAEADRAFAESQDAQLKTAWGPEYNRNRERANRAASEIFGEDFDAIRHMETKDGRFVMDNTAMLKAFARIGSEMGEGVLGGALTEGDRATLDEQAEGIRKQKHEALARGDNSTADALLQKEQEIYRRRERQTQSAVGSGTRMV